MLLRCDVLMRWVFLFVSAAAVCAGAESLTPEVDPQIAASGSTLTVLASPSPSTYGQVVTLTAIVTTGATGKVTFYDGVKILGTATIAGGQAVIGTPMLPAGAKSLWAHYNGDQTYLASNAPKVAHTVAAGVSRGLKRPVTILPATSVSSVAVGDLNGDGKMDVVVASSQTTSISVLLGNGNGTFQAAVNYTVAS